MTSYEPTGGDGRYSRLYLADLEPTADDLAATFGRPLDQLAEDLDEALLHRQPADAAALIREIRALVRPTTARRSRADTPPGPTCRNHPTTPATHTAVMPAQEKRPGGTYDKQVPLCPNCAVRIGAIGFQVQQR